MSRVKNASKNESHAEEVEQEVNLEGLQRLLRKGLRCDELEVVDYSACKLLPLGENYLSILVKVDASVRKAKNAEEESLHLVAKTNVADEKLIVDWLKLLPKEVFVYTELLPAYRRVEREAGLREDELFDILPKYMGHCFSLKCEDKVDETGLFLMENLITRGYYVCDRFKGVDLEHARKALSALARYHALGIALKQKHPKFFERVIAHAQVFGIDVDEMKSGYALLKESFCQNRCFAKYMPRIEQAFHALLDNWDREVEENEWTTVTHGDFWSNNMLFRRDADGRVDDVKFIDFQLYYHTSPLKDLPYFLCSSLDEATKRDNFEDLLSVYHEDFLKTLTRMGCDTTQLSREAFDEELKKQAIEIFPVISMALKFTKYQVKPDDKDRNELGQNLFGNNNMSDELNDDLLKLVRFYEDKNWF